MYLQINAKISNKDNIHSSKSGIRMFSCKLATLRYLIYIYCFRRFRKLT